MSYNTELAENNAALRAILEQAQSLPDKDTGGGVTIQSGSFTPTENLTEYTIPVNGTVKNFCFYKKTNAFTYRVRTYLGIIHLENNDWTMGMTTNASGATPAGSTENNGAKWISITENEVKLKGSSATFPGYLVPEQYNWIAW